MIGTLYITYICLWVMCGIGLLYDTKTEETRSYSVRNKKNLFYRSRMLANKR